MNAMVDALSRIKLPGVPPTARSSPAAEKEHRREIDYAAQDPTANCGRERLPQVLKVPLGPTLKTEARQRRDPLAATHSAPPSHSRSNLARGSGSVWRNRRAGGLRVATIYELAAQFVGTVPPGEHAKSVEPWRHLRGT